MKKHLFFWVTNLLLLLPMVGSAIYYIVDFKSASAAFSQFGYPSYTVAFNATAKFLGAIAIVFPVPSVFKEWAYAGYLFILLLATQAVWLTMPGIPWPMFGFLGIWALAYWRYRAR